MTDIVDLLYEHALGHEGKGDDYHCLAAQEIVRLRNALEQIIVEGGPPKRVIKIARAALVPPADRGTPK